MNTRDKAKGLCVTSERHIGTLGVRCREALRRVARCMGLYLLRSIIIVLLRGTKLIVYEEQIQ